MVSLLSYPFFKESTCVAESQLVYDNDHHDEQTNDKLNVFDDLEALESGHAKEFIPYNYLTPSKDWWLCKIKRKNFVEFSMHLEPSCGRMVADKFILSAKRVGDDFYISQYEYFGAETPADEIPKGRYCAILKSCKTKNNNNNGNIKEPKRSWELFPASLGNLNNNKTSVPLSIITHTVIKQPESKADIRIMDIHLPDYNSSSSSTDDNVLTNELNAKYNNFDNDDILSEKMIDVNKHIFVWDLNRRERSQHSSSFLKQTKLSHQNQTSSSFDDLVSLKTQSLSSRSSSSSSSISSSSSSYISSPSSSKSSSPLSAKHRALSEESGKGNHHSVKQHNNDDVSAKPLKLSVSSQVPRWDNVRGSLLMKFLRSRVKATSSKNYVFFESEQVRGGNGSNWRSGTEVHLPNAVVQFGKFSENLYTLDFRHPVAPLQAFAMALSSFPNNPDSPS